MDLTQKQFFAAQAWVNGAWARDVLLSVDASGHWCAIQTHAISVECLGATRLSGPVLPGVVNAHSHAFQRAIAGLTERRGTQGTAQSDDFWSWRDRMYSVARRITPEQLEAIASFLYAELLTAGYTQVCEFHYLHHQAEGSAVGDPLDMSMALVRAAQRVGMGLTLLPTLYMRSGFAATGLREDQHRFASSPESVLRLVDGVQTYLKTLEATQSSAINVGLAIHSLRAADEVAIHELATEANARGLPVHIHIAEQTQEVQDCLSHTGQRPIEWLLTHLPVNEHWNLVHATHTTPAELQAVQRSGAAIIICPSTEANLGDGVFDYSGYANLGGRWSIGSDSHVTRSWTEELRLLEYSQRLTQRKRNVAAQSGPNPSSAATLFESALAGGQAATSKPLGSIAVGHRADFLVLDDQSPSLLGVPSDHLLDALVFSSPDARCSDVFIAGKQVVQGGQVGGNLSGSEDWCQIKQNFVQTMAQLWTG
jgi:formimidoylglutamate deiminase